MIRRRGDATSAGESEIGGGSVAVAVRDPAGKPRAGLSVALPLVRWSASFEQHAVEQLTQGAVTIGPADL